MTNTETTLTKQRLLTLAEALPGTQVQTPHGPGFITRTLKSRVEVAVLEHIETQGNWTKTGKYDSAAVNRYDNWTDKRLKCRQLQAVKDDSVALASTIPSISVRLGTDPEIFVEDSKGVVPAWTFLPDRKNHLGAYWDGFQAEFRTEAMHCLEIESEEVYLGLEKIQKALPKGSKLSTKSVIEIPQKLLLESQERYVRLGCDPSHNAYETSGKDIPDGRKLRLRFAGGHIHFGTPWVRQNYHSNHCILEAVKTLDALVGVAAVGLFQRLDDPRRRKYYGLAGEYRLPPHGLEYRVLSNAWLTSAPAMHLTFDIAREAFRMGMVGWRKLLDAPEREVQEIINSCDSDAAWQLIRRNQAIWEGLITRIYGHAAIKPTLQALHGGIQEFVSIKEIDLKSFRDGSTWGITIGF